MIDTLEVERNFRQSPDDVIKWKHFPRYWPVVRGIHRWPVNSPHKGQWRRALMFDLRLNQRLSKQWWGWWSETLSSSLSRHCNGIKEWYIPVDSVVYIYFRTLQVSFFFHNNTPESCIIVIILVCVWFQTIFGKSKCQIRVFSLCFPNIRIFLSVLHIDTYTYI